MTFTELILSAITNAMRGIPPNVAASSNAGFIAQTLFPTISQSVSESAANDPHKRSLLRREKTVTLVAGEADITEDVLTKYFVEATLLNPSDLSKRYAYRDYPDFVRRGDKRYGVFTRNGTTLMVVDPNANFTQPLTATGTRTLVVPCVVTIPALATDDIDAPDEILSDISEALTEALRGQITKQAGLAA
jgi:hypothetical protein